MISGLGIKVKTLKRLKAGTNAVAWMAVISESNVLPSSPRRDFPGGPEFSDPEDFCIGSDIFEGDVLQGRDLLPAFPVGSERAASRFDENS